MIIGRNRFNIYLLPLLAAALLSGCRTHKNPEEDKKKEMATFRVHIEATADDAFGGAKAQIYRAAPVELTIEKDPFLTEAQVASAQVVNALGGFDLRIQLNTEGTWLLQSYSASHPGKHYAIFSQFGEKSNKGRWLAAPMFGRVMSDGVLQFTPDASHEEAEEIALGVNNMAKKFENSRK
jgi:hypothetical protein